MVEKVAKVAKNYKVAQGDRAKSPTRISAENKGRLTKLAGQLQNSTGKRQTLDDAITYLFVNQRKEKDP